jgi:hypothetical protein
LNVNRDYTHLSFPEGDLSEMAWFRQLSVDR